MHITHDWSSAPDSRPQIHMHDTKTHISIVLFQSSSSPAFLLGKYTTRSRSFRVHALTDRCTTRPAVLAGEPSYSAVLAGNLLAKSSTERGRTTYRELG